MQTTATPQNIAIHHRLMLIGYTWLEAVNQAGLYTESGALPGIESGPDADCPCATCTRADWTANQD